MDKKKIIFLTDMALIPVFALTAYTGIELHVAGHGTDHQVWHDMAVFHSIAGFSFLILGRNPCQIPLGMVQSVEKQRTEKQK